MSAPIDKDWLERETHVEPHAADVDLEQLPKCPECGYIIYKVARFRCPECGTDLRAEDINVPWVRQEMDRLARVHRRNALIGLVLILAGGACIAWVVGLSLAGFLCFALPLGALTLGTVAYQFYLGEELHGALLILGTLWIVVGLYLVAARYL